MIRRCTLVDVPSATLKSTSSVLRAISAIAELLVKNFYFPKNLDVFYSIRYTKHYGIARICVSRENFKKMNFMYYVIT